MSIQTQLFALLSGATDAGVRIYPLTAPDQVTRPYISYQRIFANSENAMSGSTGLTNTHMQIDVYADGYSQAQTIAAQIDGLMFGWTVQNVSQSSQDFYEHDTKLYRVHLVYSIWHS